MISGSKSGSTGFFGASSAASGASPSATVFTSASAMSAHLHEDRLFGGEYVRVGVVVQRDRLDRALAHAHAAALAGGRLDLGLLGLDLDDRDLVGADAHARE